MAGAVGGAVDKKLYLGYNNGKPNECYTQKIGNDVRTFATFDQDKLFGFLHKKKAKMHIGSTRGIQTPAETSS